MSQSKIACLLKHVERRQLGCPLFKLQTPPNFFPINNIHFDSSTGTVPVQVCEHDGTCSPNSEILYFLLSATALGFISPEQWSLLFPEANVGARSETCCGFKLVFGKKKRTIFNHLQAGVDYDPVTLLPFTSPCDHSSTCFADTRWKYALAYVTIKGWVPQKCDNFGE